MLPLSSEGGMRYLRGMPAVDQATLLADTLLVNALRGGDDQAFTALVADYGASTLRVARPYTPSLAVAEEVVQEAWLGVLRGIERFESRSSLKT
jgi:RNA polymerase sigma-70 factor (ECF subfamily)